MLRAADTFRQSRERHVKLVAVLQGRRMNETARATGDQPTVMDRWVAQFANRNEMAEKYAALLSRHAPQGRYMSGRDDRIGSGIGYGTTRAEHDAAFAALDALLAENQRLREALLLLADNAEAGFPSEGGRHG